MSSNAPSLPYVDVTGTPDLPSPEAGLPKALRCRTQTTDWAQQAGRLFARKPGYMLAGAAGAGFLVGRMVKGLLSSNGRGS
jgi:hypothetical protein